MSDVSGAPISLPCSAQYDLSNPVTNLKYRIQISWPLNWTRVRGNQDVIPVIYVLDGSAFFLTASEILWRRGTSPDSGICGIIVAISYQSDPAVRGSVFDTQRNIDLTLPCQNDLENGRGGADQFLDFIEHDVKPLVRAVFPEVKIGNEAIFGHSFGGLCVLHALFTRDGMFDMYFAASPSIWWDETILKEEEQYTKSDKHNDGEKKPYLELSYGKLEQDPKRLVTESTDAFEGKSKRCLERGMGAKAVSLYERLSQHDRLEKVSLWEFEDEDHGTVATSALLKAVTRVFAHPNLV